MRRVALLLGLLCAACQSRPRGSAPIELTLRYGQTQARSFGALVAAFRAAHPEVRVRTELVSNVPDALHQLYVTALEGGAEDFDLFIIDVTWTAELARAGWIADLSDAFPPSRLRQVLLPAAASAAIVDGKTYGMPYFTDAGLLYYRKDLAPRPPRTYVELVQNVRAAQKRDPRILGYLWQGRQYEGLICNVLEAMWGHGARTSAQGRVILTTAEAEAGLGYLRGLIERGVSPPSVTSATEESTRLLFQSGRALYMRNWPYAFAELERPGSPVAGKVGLAPLPSLTGEPGPGTFGGWQLAMGARIAPGKRAVALALMAHLTSHEANLALALTDALSPPRRAVYDDARLRAGRPLAARLLPILEAARPRPQTPYYLMISDALQSELSGAVVGLRSPRQALERAQAQIDHIAAQEVHR